MVETFFLDWPLSFGVGALFGLAGIGAPGFASRAFRTGFAYLQVGIVGIALALFALRPDWMWMYWVDAGALPVAVTVLAFVLYEVCFVAGFAIAQALSRRTAIVMTTAVVLGLTAAQLLTWNRLTQFGTLAEYTRGASRGGIATDPLHLEPAMAIVMFAGTASLGVAVFLAVRLWRATAGARAARRAPSPS